MALFPLLKDTLDDHTSAEVRNTCEEIKSMIFQEMCI